MREPLSEISYRALQVVKDRAKREGLDLFEELNRVGFVATEPRIQEIRKSALADVVRRLELMGPSELMADYQRGNSNPATTYDVFNAIINWINSYGR